MFGSKAKKTVKKAAKTKKKAAKKQARSDKKAAKKQKKASKKAAKQEKRDALADIRNSDLSGKDKKQAKKAAKKTAKKKVQSAKKTAKKKVQAANETKKDKVQAANATKKKQLDRAVDPSFGSAEKFAPGIWAKTVELAKRHGLTKSAAMKPGAALEKLVARVQAKTLEAALVEAGLFKFFRAQSISGNFAKNPFKHPARLAFATKDGALTGTLGRTWIHPVPYDRDEVRFCFQKTGGAGKAGVTLLKITPRGKAVELWTFGVAPGQDDTGRTWARSFKGVRGCLIAAVVDGKSATRKIEYELKIERPAQGKVVKPKRSPKRRVEGFADLHAHHMSHLGFAGALIAPGPMEPLPKDCGGKHAKFGGSHDKVGTKRDHDWPVSHDSCHQVMHWTHLREAMNAEVTGGRHGLRLMISPSVNNMFVSHLIKHKDRDIPLNDMDAIRLQLKAHHAFAERFDWYEIALDPWHARRIIAAGKLAVILSVECSHLMPKSHGEWRDQLDELWDLGVRAMQITHENDTRFAGAALQHGRIFGVKHLLKKPAWNQMDPDMREAYEDSMAHISKIEKQAKVSLDRYNPVGVTPEGFQLLTAMAERGMILEIDHISRAGRKQLFDWVRSRKTPAAARWYPLNFTHSRVDELMPSKDWFREQYGEQPKYTIRPPVGWDGKFSTLEYMATIEEIKWLIPTGGVFGVRTGPNAQEEYTASGVDNRCHTSSRSLAQMLAQLRDLGVAVSLGTDIDGFTTLTGARFERPKGEQRQRKQELVATGVPKQRPDNLKRDKPVERNGELSEFNFLGFAHHGFAPDLIQDIENLGLDVRAMRASAESTLRMWERCHDPGRKKLSKAEYTAHMVTDVAKAVK
ncbi:peptidase, M19 family protein [Plesiocystis pacifica SIR-1]|uniref:Peptidase, M19 family protein n=1 Tax=Plesiocystis pacifica SIR-1 TaxID=391625 RepID=A6GHA5_9BACT|nr:peptidase, M19 family protein [Plesiocystis pacifica SIR-1]